MNRSFTSTLLGAVLAVALSASNSGAGLRRSLVKVTGMRRFPLS